MPKLAEREDILENLKITFNTKSCLTPKVMNRTECQRRVKEKKFQEFYEIVQNVKHFT